MNAQDKAEALRLIGEVAASPTIGSRNYNKLSKIRALIERQNDTDGEMWRFCVEHGFPWYGKDGWSVRFEMTCFCSDDTPNEATDAAMAAMKEREHD